MNLIWFVATHVVLSTAQGTEFPKASYVTGHMYLACRNTSVTDRITPKYGEYLFDDERCFAVSVGYGGEVDGDEVFHSQLCSTHGAVGLVVLEREHSISYTHRHTQY